MKALLEPNDVSAMHDSLHNVHPRFGLLWLLGVDTGYRVSDLLSIRVGSTTDEMVSENRLSIRESKTGKRREVKISPGVRMAVTALTLAHRLRRGDFLFWGRSPRFACTRQWIHRLISRVAKNKGLKNVGPHSMRKIYACNIYRNTGSLKCVQEALGHSFPSTTMIYLRDLLPASNAD